MGEKKQIIYCRFSPAQVLRPPPWLQSTVYYSCSHLSDSEEHGLSFWLGKMKSNEVLQSLAVHCGQLWLLSETALCPQFGSSSC